MQGRSRWGAGWVILGLEWWIAFKFGASSEIDIVTQPGLTRAIE